MKRLAVLLRFVAVSWCAGYAGCGAGSGTADVGPAVTITPSHGSLYGQYQVTIGYDASLGNVTAVSVGGTPAIELTASGTTMVTATLQGAAMPGAADVSVTGSGGQSVRTGLFTYDAPATTVPLNWAAFGASLSMGMQSDGLDAWTQLHGPFAQAAQAAGVYLGLPLVVEGVTPPLEATDINKTTCQPNPNSANSMIFEALENVITDPVTKMIDLRRARLDWTLAPRLFAVGGSTVQDILSGGRSTFVAALEHIVRDPSVDPGDAFGPIDVSQIAYLEMIDPDVVLCSDLLANDIDGSVTQGDDLHVENITPVATLVPLLAQVMQRLGALHGQYFIANLPSLTFIPNVVALRAERIAAGTDTAASYDAKVQMIDDATDAFNAALTTAMQPYKNLHLVDFAGTANTIRTTGLTVTGKSGPEVLTVAHLGGLLSLDDLHFTDTGYAMLANVFLDAVNATMSLAIPHVDVASVFALDPLSPDALRADGLTCVPN